MDIEQEFHSQISHNNNNNLVLTDAEQQQQQQHQHLTNNNDNESALFRGWHNSSRIFRVSRASGGKDRHSKVLTSKGLRDRRVRLSVSTAIQFYDLQDRLGYDQPSKAVEWLIKAAADSISELPSLNGPFPNFEGDQHHQQKTRNLSASSTSETSKGSGLSLTQSDVRVNQRVKARERARDRAKEKESSEQQQQVVNVGQRRRSPVSTSSTATFTELLTGGQSGSSPNNSSVPMMDYFMANNAAVGRSNAHAAPCLFLGQSLMGRNMPPAFHLTSGNHLQHDQEQFSFGQQNLIESGNEHQYDLNFTISSTSSPSGFNNRGTLQSNSHSTMHHNHLQRYSMEGSNNVPASFYMTTSAADNLNNNTNQHHHFSTGLDGGLHLYYGDHKDKGGKN